MKKIKIKGNQEFNGRVAISGSKNATLPILAATMLTNKLVTLKAVPNISDVNDMLKLLTHIGSQVKYNKTQSTVEILNEKLHSTVINKNIARRIRASSLLIGPLLATAGNIVMPISGGCNIGERPLDIHIGCFKKMGAQVKKIEDGMYHIETKQPLKGIDFHFSTISVGATSNIIMAATMASSTTNLSNIAIEPEVLDLINFLKKLGFNININLKKRTATIIPNHVQNFKDCMYTIIPDRIETATYVIGTAIAGRKIEIKNACVPHIKYILDLLKKHNAIDFIEKKQSLIIEKTYKKIKPFNITTSPYPYFPTDLQAMITILATQASGISKITENNSLLNIVIE